MKLSLDELKVDSYAIQVSENELAEVKGGTYSICLEIGISVATLVLAGYEAFKTDPLKKSGGTSGGMGGSGATNWTFETGQTDSVKIVRPDGTTITYYGLESGKYSN